MSRSIIKIAKLTLLGLLLLSGRFSGIYAQEVNHRVKPKLLSITALDKNTVQLHFDGKSPVLHKRDIHPTGDLTVKSIRTKKNTTTLKTSRIQINRDYFFGIDGYGQLPVDLGPVLDKVASPKPLGFSIQGKQTVFRLFAPRSHTVNLVLFDRHDATEGKAFQMTPSPDGVWEVRLQGRFWGKYYGYKLSGPAAPFEKFSPDKVIADPYSIAVCSKNNYHHEAKSIILDTSRYDWEGDRPVHIAWEDLIIYEMHIRDMTADASSRVKEKGTYHGFIEKNRRGGLDYVKKLGVNAVELLPIQDFGNIELPYNVEINGVKNTWNPYERNHWGYMTSYFFAPESYYASGGNMTLGEYNGIHGQQVNEFKDLIKTLHAEGIAVILDVVYNHVSQYDLNPFKYIDKVYYFHLNPEMDFLSFSGCGNDFKTDRPMARRMILDSIKYWLKEYHVDGFRFDLAAMLDWKTVEAITKEARKINPDVILVAEPWGGGKYDLAGFSDRGWAAWNDLIRNGVKGQNPENGLGWIFGEYWNDNSAEKIKSYIKGSTRKYGGPFKQKSHSINYLESHDDNTLGDFIRIGSGEVNPQDKIRDLEANAKLTPLQLQLNKLAAAFLFTSQGVVMIHEGQEFARSKVIAQTDAPDPNIGHIDHNSYNKDNETNWLNFDFAALNENLVNYYRGLIALRKKYRAFRATPSESIQFIEARTNFSVGYVLPKAASGDPHNLAVLMNANPHEKARFHLPQGHWQKLVDGAKAGIIPFGKPVKRTVTVPARTALVLID